MWINTKAERKNEEEVEETNLSSEGKSEVGQEDEAVCLYCEETYLSTKRNDG